MLKKYRHDYACSINNPSIYVINQHTIEVLYVKCVVDAL